MAGYPRKSDIKKAEKLKEEIRKQQEELSKIANGVYRHIGEYVCEKYDTLDTKELIDMIDKGYDLTKLEEASKGTVVENENPATYTTNQ